MSKKAKYILALTILVVAGAVAFSAKTGLFQGNLALLRQCISLQAACEEEIIQTDDSGEICVQYYDIYDSCPWGVNPQTSFDAADAPLLPPPPPMEASGDILPPPAPVIEPTVLPPPVITPRNPSDRSMSFFVTSRGIGNGGNFGGLAGADAFCRQLAGASPVQVAGQKTWKAYLSNAYPSNPDDSNAIDRIGNGPWYNSAGFEITKDILRSSGIPYDNLLDERGVNVQRTNEHDIVTGSDRNGNLKRVDDDPSGAPYTCRGEVNGNLQDWVTGTDDASTYVGHADWDKAESPQSWNSAHDVSCSQQSFNESAGVGRLYCFAIN